MQVQNKDEIIKLNVTTISLPLKGKGDREAVDEVQHMKGKCYIVGGGENFGLTFKKEPGDYVIAADAGYRHLEKVGLRADMVVGDFDSLGTIPDHPNLVKLNPIKDVTDTWEAVRLGLKKGYTEFHLYACTGGRIDHTVANVQLLSNLAESGSHGYLYDKDSVLTVIKDSSIAFDASKKGYLSVFSLTNESKGVTLNGFKYELTDSTLSNTFPLGVSNEFIGKDSEISVKEGSLLIVFPR